MYFIDGKTLNPEKLQKIIDEDYKIDLTPEAWKQVIRSRKALYDMMSEPDKIVYGINTGFGNFANKIISKNDRILLQVNLIRSHAVGVGSNLPIRTVKKMMVLRINTLAKGRSGISPENVAKIIQAFNANYIPMIPEKGTVGASGDLAPLSHLALGLMGQGKAWNEKLNQYSDSQSIMKQKQLQPMKLQQKEGLALINGTQFMSSIISEVSFQANKVLDSAIIVFCFAIEIFGLPQDFFSQKIIELYNKTNPGLAKIMMRIQTVLGNSCSELHKERIKTGNVNSHSFSLLHMCQALAAIAHSIQLSIGFITEQMNSATDNPLVVFTEDGQNENQLISAGNFHGEYVAKAADLISMSLFNLARFSESRIQRYVNDRISQLPAFLIKQGGLNSGFMIVQYTSAALLSESKILVKPASVDSISTSASQEDHVSMGGFAVTKCRDLLKNTAFILGIELMSALQAIDILGLQPSNNLSQIKKKVRQKIPFMKNDIYYGPFISKAQEFIIEGL